jgi:TolB-like protein/DNA-binding winged helix-turn-helix (wHTH) protein/Flp pilus assembly protein TadD
MIASSTSRRVKFGDFVADFDSFELRKHGIRLKLQDQPFQILKLLLQRPGQLVTREELRMELWTESTFVDFDAGLNAAIRRLRDALNESAEEPRYIETLPRHGYRFIASVEMDAEMPAPQPDAVQPAPGNARGQQEAEALPNPAIQNRFANFQRMLSPGGLVVAGLLLAALGAGAVVLRSKVFAKPSVGNHINSIAVLPLQNLSADPTQDYFADGMTDALITDLAQAGSLRVISRTSAMQYKGSRKTLPVIGKELNVDAVVEGSVVRSGDRVRIDVQLIQSDNDFRIWGKSYDRRINDILVLQADVVHSISNEIEATLGSGQKTVHSSAKPVNPEAYDAYLKGVYFYDGPEQTLSKAVKYYKKSVDLDPNYAPANLGLGEAYGMMAYIGQGDIPAEQAWDQSEIYLAKTLQLDPNSSLAHTLIGMNRLIRRCNRIDAERELDLALQLNPNDMRSLDYHSYFLLEVGRGDEALAEKKRVLESDPVSVGTNSEYGLYLLKLDRIDEAIQQFQNTLELDPNDSMTLSRLGMSYARKHEYEKAIELVKNALAIDDKPVRRRLLGSIYVEAGRPDEARKVLAELKELSKQRYVSPSLIASLYALFGDKDQAIAWLDKAHKDDFPPPSDPDFENLRVDPRFAEIEARLKPRSACKF